MLSYFNSLSKYFHKCLVQRPTNNTDIEQVNPSLEVDGISNMAQSDLIDSDTHNLDDSSDDVFIDTTTYTLRARTDDVFYTVLCGKSSLLNYQTYLLAEI